MYNKELMLFGNRTYCRKIPCVFNGYEKNAPIVAIDYLSACHKMWMIILL